MKFDTTRVEQKKKNLMSIPTKKSSDSKLNGMILHCETFTHFSDKATALNAKHWKIERQMADLESWQMLRAVLTVSAQRTVAIEHVCYTYGSRRHLKTHSCLNIMD